jgi:molybdopterin-biosynthesis enzyme MoeA-like protein
MIRIWAFNARNYKVLLDLQTRVPREFKPCWIQEVVRFTDALGRVAPIHLELVNSWEVLESVLTARFKNVPGRQKVEVGEYALQDRVSLRDIKKSQPFEANFLPGRKIDMSIVFRTEYPTGNSCPGCNVESESDRIAATLW